MTERSNVDSQDYPKLYEVGMLIDTGIEVHGLSLWRRKPKLFKDYDWRNDALRQKHPTSKRIPKSQGFKRQI